MNDSYVIMAILLLGVGFLMFFLEIFLPSGGILSIVAAVAMVSGVALLFNVDTNLGLAAAVVCVGSLPFMAMFGVHFWPHTPFAQWLMLKSEPKQADNDEAENDDPKRIVNGSEGQAVTDLRPIGFCTINGQRIECISVRGVIEAGDAVRITDAGGMTPKVRRVEV